MLVCLEALEGAELVLVDSLFAFVLRPGQGALFEILANSIRYCNIAASSLFVMEQQKKKSANFTVCILLWLWLKNELVLLAIFQPKQFC